MPTHEIDVHLPYYLHFFDLGWSRRFLSIIDGTPLHDPGWNLATSWKSQSAAHSMPSLFVRSMEVMWNASLTAPGKAASLILQGCRDEILRRVHGLNPTKQQQIRGIVAERANRYEGNEIEKFDMEGTWKGLFGTEEFRLSIHGNMRNVFCTLFHDFENYVRDVIGVLNGGNRVRMSGFDAVVRELEKRLDKAVVEKFLGDSDIQICKLVRNAFSHSGGLETPEVKAEKHWFPVHDGTLHILAHHNIRLFNRLAWAVDGLSEAALVKLGLL